MLTIVGELVVKNLVLLYAGLVVTSGVHATAPAVDAIRGPPTQEN